MKKLTVGLWCPSSPAAALFPKRFVRSVENLKKGNFESVISDSCKQIQLFNEDYKEILVEELYSYLRNPQIDIILFVTGGLTTLTLLDAVDWEYVKKYPKPIIGYSDATSFLIAYYARTNLECFHGPMLISEWGEYNGISNYSLECLDIALTNSDFIIKPPILWTEELLFWDTEDTRSRKMKKNDGWIWYRKGKAKGKLVGGNLSTICTLLGSKYLPSFKNKILFLEEDSCAPDEMLAKLQSLEFAGIFEQICGLIIGKIANKKITASGVGNFETVYRHIFNKYTFPILTEVDFGHTEPMLTFPIGRTATMDSNADGILIKKADN